MKTVDKIDVDNKLERAGSEGIGFGVNVYKSGFWLIGTFIWQLELELSHDVPFQTKVPSEIVGPPKLYPW